MVTQEMPLVGANIDIAIEPNGEIVLHILSETEGYPDSHMAFTPKMAYDIGKALIEAAHASAQRFNKNAN